MDKLQEMIDKWTEQNRKLRSKEMITLGEFIKELEKYPRDWSITIEPFDLTPVDFCSYRGYYSDLALTYTADWDSLEHVKVGNILDKAKEALNKEFIGYKGGDFLMTKDTPLWVSNYGRCSDITIAKIEEVYDGLIALNCYKRED